MQRRETEIVVVGAGITGASAAWHLVRRGHRVALLEQFELAHTRGSSHGASRIFRFAYEQAEYVRLAQRALPLWREAEAELGHELLRIMGGIDVGPRRHLRPIADALAEAGAALQWLDRTDAMRRFPWLSLPPDWEVLFQPDAGVVAADAARAGLATLAERHGANVHEHTRVEELVPDDGGVTVRTDRGEWRAEQVVVANAGWSLSLLRALGLDVPIVVTREQVLYIPVQHDVDLVPFIWHGGSAHPEFYGLPNWGHELKVGEHGTGPVIEPGEEGAPDPAAVDRVLGMVRENLRGITAEPRGVDTCLYASTPDDDFVIDRAGPIILAVGFGGHGYKFGSLLGELIAELIDGADGISPRFGRARFASQQPALPAHFH